jgi:hypothetical protein
MTTWWTRGLLLAGLAFAVLAPQAASAQDYPYCLQGQRWGYPGNCQFQTYEQCRVTASGTIDDCGINPRFAFAPQGRVPGGHWGRPYPPYPYQGW